MNNSKLMSTRPHRRCHQSTLLSKTDFDSGNLFLWSLMKMSYWFNREKNIRVMFKMGYYCLINIFTVYYSSNSNCLHNIVLSLHLVSISSCGFSSTTEVIKNVKMQTKYKAINILFHFNWICMKTTTYLCVDREALPNDTLSSESLSSIVI